MKCATIASGQSNFVRLYRRGRRRGWAPRAGQWARNDNGGSRLSVTELGAEGRPRLLPRWSRPCRPPASSPVRAARPAAAPGRAGRMDELGGLPGDAMLEESGFKDQLQALLEDADSFQPGSQERNNSLEQIRTLLVDRSSQMRRGSAGDRMSGAEGGMMLSTSGQSLPRSKPSRQGSFLTSVASPEERQSVLELYDPSDSSMSAIHEPAGVWGSSGHTYVRPAHLLMPCASWGVIPSAFSHAAGCN